MLEPLDGILLLELVVRTDLSLSSLSAGDTVTSTATDNVEVHTINTDIRVVLDTQVDVLVDTEAEVTSVGEVLGLEFVFLDLETSLQNFLSLWSSDGDVDRNLFVSSDREGSDGVSSLGVDWSLTGELFEHLGSSGKSVTGLTDTDVENKLLNLDLLHRISRLVFSFGLKKKK